MHDFRVTVTQFFLRTREKELLSVFRFLSNADYANRKRESLSFTFKGITMTQNQFNALCNEHGIAPSIALENEELIEALRERNDEQVIRIITEEF